MTALVHPSTVARRRRQWIGAVNRRVGWVLLPVMIAATALHYLPLHTYLTTVMFAGIAVHLDGGR